MGRVSGLRAFYRPATRTPEPKALDGFEGVRHAEGWGGNGPGLVQHAGCGFKHPRTHGFNMPPLSVTTNPTIATVTTTL